MSEKFTIRVRRQKGPGYWATIHKCGILIDAVQHHSTYGFETAKEARQAAQERIEALSPNRSKKV